MKTWVRKFARLCAASAVGLAAATAAFGADLPATNAPMAPAAPSPVFEHKIFSEVRIGGSAQDPWSPEKDTYNVTGEVLFAKPFHLDGWKDVFVPRIHVGGSANFSGKTSFLYAGLTWDYDITPKIFIEASFGGMIHNGDTLPYARPGHNALGCSPMFHEAASLGYRFDAHWSIIGTIEHSSNAGFCNQNRGLTNVGAKIGYTF